MDLIDTHCHIQSIGGASEGESMTRQLWSKAGDLQADIVLAEARDAGVRQMICVGCDLEDSQLAIEFVNNREECSASIGLHPHEAKRYAGQSKLLDQFADLAQQPKVVAIGECGFDFYYNHSPKEAQIEILKFQIEVALQYQLPLIFHVREAFDDFWPVFDGYSGITGVLHSFTDTEANMLKAVERNLYIGVNGIATFTKDPVQLETYRSIPLENLVLETDAPFLTPKPYRGTINEPKRVGTVADFLSDLRGESRESLAAATTQNAKQLFKLAN